MANTIINHRTYPFFDSVKSPISTPGTSTAFNNTNGYSAMMLEVSGTASALDITIEGCINMIDQNGSLKPEADCEWTALQVISISNSTKATKISAKGIYIILIGGLSKIRVKVNSITGSASIVGDMNSSISFNIGF